jgi:hypothetical protein
MVKQILAFLKWKISKYTVSDYLWMTACIMVAVGYYYAHWVFWIGLTLGAGSIFSFLIRIQWEQWKQERNKLFETIKDGK